MEEDIVRGQVQEKVTPPRLGQKWPEAVVRDFREVAGEAELKMKLLGGPDEEFAGDRWDQSSCQFPLPHFSKQHK